MAPALLPDSTSRLAYRPFTPGDLDDAFALLGDPEVMRYSLAGAHRDLATTAAWIEKAAVPHAGFSFGPTAIVERASSRVIGANPGRRGRDRLSRTS